MKTVEKPVSEMTTKELEEFLKKKKSEEAAKRERERVKYEKERDTAIGQLMEAAREASLALARLKSMATSVMDGQHMKLEEYGALRKNSKGGFNVTNSAGTARVTRRIDSDPKWDERAEKGVELIKEFLADAVKKRDKKLFEILLSFLERNKKGDLEYAKVLTLMQHRDKYSDERWLEGLRLLEESYSLIRKGFAYYFEVKEKEGDKWQKVELNFHGV